MNKQFLGPASYLYYKDETVFHIKNSLKTHKFSKVCYCYVCVWIDVMLEAQNCKCKKTKLQKAK